MSGKRTRTPLLLALALTLAVVAPFSGWAQTNQSISNTDSHGKFVGGDLKAWKKSGALIDAGKVWMHDGKIHQAIKCYKEAVRVYPSSYVGWFQLGNTSRTLGEVQSAEDYFKKSLAIEPKFIEANVAMSDVCMLRKKYKEAELYIRKALQLKPNSFDYKWSLGDILCHAGKYKESLAIYKEIAKCPDAKKVQSEMDAWHEELMEHVSNSSPNH